MRELGTSTSLPSTWCWRSRRTRQGGRRAARAGASHEQLLKALAEVRGSHRVTDQNPEDKFQALESYGRDLTEAAAQGKLDPVIGRDDEIRRVIQVSRAARRTTPS